VSASLNNAGLELIKEESAAVPRAARTASPTDNLGHEALQALLAFSSLHQQIRTRRAKQMLDGGRSSTHDDWQLEQFVLDEVLQLVAERALAITGADGVAIALAGGNAIVCRASAGSIAPDAGVHLDPNSGFSGECLVSGRIVRCDDVDTDSRVDLLACRRLGVRSMLAVPFSAKQSVIGLLEAFSNEPYGFNDSDVRSLNLLAELILSALRPEEEDRLTEISQRVVRAATGEPKPIPVVAPAPEIAKVQTEPPAENLQERPELESAIESAIGGSLESSPERTVENSEVVSQETPETSSGPLALAEHEGVDRSRPGLAVVAAVVFFAVALGAGLWWTLGHHARLIGARASARSVASGPAAPTASAAIVPAQPTAPAALTVAEEEESDPATPEEAGLLPRVTGIRHWSADESSTVVIDIQDQVQYEAHRLPNPERIYFDLHDTTLAAGFSARTIAVNDALLQRIRVAQPVTGVTRVVLETNGASDFSVSLEPNPYRLVVEIHKLGTGPRTRAKIDLFAPLNPAPMDQATAVQAPTNQPQADQVAANQKPLNLIPLNPNPLSPQNPLAGSGNEEKRPAVSAKPMDTGQTRTPVYPPKLRVVLDAGHGGWDLGTVGRKGLLEKDLVLDLVKRVGHLVESHLGAEVIFTRSDDSYLALEKRAEIANLSQANLFVSVHANYSDYPSARGVETYYTNTYSSVKARTEEADEAAAAGLQTINWTDVDIREKVHESRRVAASVQRALYRMLAAKNPGLRNRGVKEAHYVVLTGTSMPAILAEVSFVSSPTDENNLQSSNYRQQIAEALYEGIARYEASSRDLKIASAAKPTGR
jgi:N-acetylmuramoyl-L-alanine amidase